MKLKKDIRAANFFYWKKGFPQIGVEQKVGCLYHEVCGKSNPYDLRNVIQVATYTRQALRILRVTGKRGSCGQLAKSTSGTLIGRAVAVGLRHVNHVAKGGKKQ